MKRYYHACILYSQDDVFTSIVISSNRQFYECISIHGKTYLRPIDYQKCAEYGHLIDKVGKLYVHNAIEHNFQCDRELFQVHPFPIGIL